MPVQQKKLRVLPNPWTHIDEKGHANGVCIVEQPGHGASDRRWVGAHISKVKEIEPPKRVTIGGRTHEQKSGIHHCTYSYVTEPVVVENSAYYRKMVSKGDLIAADALSAKACGISAVNFVEPSKLLEQLKQAAIVQFELENGAGSYDALAEIEQEEAEEEAAVARAVAEGKGEAPAEAEAEPAPSPAGGDASGPGSELVSETKLSDQPVPDVAAQPAAPAEASSSVVEPDPELALSTESNSRRRLNKGGSDQ